ncbi:Leucine rich repeat protein [Ectocarpus siliculosus]|uniref:Leucine rich repeat protein n=1 Tax=Ectocarpus siliculosus TaxID=2880 RepID=D7G8A7_ECTSI|nr:Leucine rich repeat protein [Ectocarpus siliculosus]|eukprot:CBJ27959.1 Leucine rich repeat protein [Ectocarpus siliculosus]
MVQADRKILALLYHSTGGPAWSRSHNWNTKADISSWRGVKVNSKGRVVQLDLSNNKLEGVIPKELGNLRALTSLDLRSNELKEHIPKQLGSLTALEHLDLSRNQLGGSIPTTLGALSKLKTVQLHANKLTGNIPKSLGALRKLQELSLYNNELSGPIPKELGALTELQKLDLYRNNLSGPIPPEFGYITALVSMILFQNNLTGGIPKQLGNITGLHTLEIHRNQLSGNIPSELGALRNLESLWLCDNQLSGPVPASLGQLTNLQRIELDNNRIVGGPMSGESLGLWMARLRRQETARHGKKETTMDTISSPIPGARQAGSNGQGSRRRGVQTHGGQGHASKGACLTPGFESVLHHHQNGCMQCIPRWQRRRQSLGSYKQDRGYEHAGFAAEALKAGDNNIQTRRVIKMTDLAPDAVECCSVAKLLGLRLTDYLSDETITTSYDGRGGPVHSAAGFGEGAGIGACEWSQSNGGLPDCASDEDFMEWFAEEAASCVPNNTGKSTPEEKTGRRLGKRHIRMILAAVERGCLQGTHAIEEKVEQLLKVVVPEAGAKPVSNSNAQERSFEQHPAAPAPSHDGGLDLHAEFAAMQAKLEALEIENGKLTRKVSTMEKSIPKPQGEPSDEVDVGGGQALAFKRKVKKTQEEVWQEMAESAAASGQRPVTQDQLRRFAEVQDERHREHDANFSWVQGALGALKKKNRKWRR